MRRLTIEGKPIPIWMETQADVNYAMSLFRDMGVEGQYYDAPNSNMIESGLNAGMTPVIHCPIAEMERILQQGTPVLFCIEQRKDKFGREQNHLANQLSIWRSQYPGMVAYGTSPNALADGRRTVGGIPHWHSMNFEAFGYS